MAALPHLGLGISTEYGAGDVSGALDPSELRARHPRFAEFLEIGVDTYSGFDAHAERWIELGAPTTYHFLDLNLDDPLDQDQGWLDELRRSLARIRPAWICGDAGLWHFGRREPGHNLLLPPILNERSAALLADGVRRLRAASGYEVLPENPPGVVYLGDLHLLDFFAQVIDRADSGMLLDCAHLAIYQKNRRLDPLTGLDGFPLERVVELHIAGGTIREVDGFVCVDDDHTTAVLPETWQIFEHVIARTPNLRAVVFECERNSLSETIPVFTRIRGSLESACGGAFSGQVHSTTSVVSERPQLATGIQTGEQARAGDPSPSMAEANLELHRAAVRMYFDPLFVRRVHDHGENELPSLASEELRWFRNVDPRAWRAAPRITDRCWAILEEEFLATVLAYETQLSLSLREQFFSSLPFHRSIANGGSLAAGFAEFLRNQLAVDVAERESPAPSAAISDHRSLRYVARGLLELEEAMAKLRRSAPNAGPERGDADRLLQSLPDRSETLVRLSPDRFLLVLPRGVSQLADDLLTTAAGRSAEDAEDPAPRDDGDADPRHSRHRVALRARVREILDGCELTRQSRVDHSPEGNAGLVDPGPGGPATPSKPYAPVVPPESAPGSLAPRQWVTGECEYVLLALYRSNGEPRARHLIAPTEVSAELFTLLHEASETSASTADWIERLLELGADLDEAESLLFELLEDGTLVPVAGRVD